MQSNLKILREQKNLTQSELAEKSGLSLRTIQRIEAGNPPKGFTLKAITEALDIQPENLFPTQRKIRQSTEQNSSIFLPCAD